MPFIVQDDTGEVENANSYLTVAAFRTYHADRGNSLTDPATGADYTDAKVQEALVRATRHLDIRHRYIGRRLVEQQTTEWPRSYIEEEFGRYFRKIHPKVLDATAEYGLRALSGKLLTDVARDASGRRLRRREYEIEGRIRENAEFVEGSDLELPEYRDADLLLRRARLVRSGGEVERA